MQVASSEGQTAQSKNGVNTEQIGHGQRACREMSKENLKFFQKIEKTFKKGIDKWEAKCYNNKADPKKGGSEIGP